MKHIDITLVTQASSPLGAADDQLLAAAIVRNGGTVRIAAWTDPRIDWFAARLTVVRSTWDYHRFPVHWQTWLNGVAPQTRLVNDVELLRWNSDKRYLFDLERRGIPIVPSLIFTTGQSSHLLGRLTSRGWNDIVIKPTIGASGYGARRFSSKQFEDAALYLAHLTRVGRALVQPYQDAVITERERSLIFIDGAFSHAFSKPPFSGGAAAGETNDSPHDPSPVEHSLANAVLATLPVNPAYARVDMVPASEGSLLMELELIEPHLALTRNPSAAGRLAEVLERRLAQPRHRDHDGLSFVAEF